jgi:hypothetical protein
MEQSLPSANKVAIKWALIYVLTGIVITYVTEIAKLDPNSPTKYLGYVPLIAFLLLAQKEYKDFHGGYVSFGDAFMTGFKYALFSGLLFGVFMYLYLTFLSPEVMVKILETQRDAMVAKGATSDQIEKSAEFMNKIGTLIVAFGVAIWYIILSTIIGLIGAAIFKKERSAYDPEPETTDPAL